MRHAARVAGNETKWPRRQSSHPTECICRCTVARTGEPQRGQLGKATATRTARTLDESNALWNKIASLDSITLREDKPGSVLDQATTRTTRWPQGQLGNHKDNQVTTWTTRWPCWQLGDHKDNQVTTRTTGRPQGQPGDHMDNQVTMRTTGWPQGQPGDHKDN